MSFHGEDKSYWQSPQNDYNYASNDQFVQNFDFQTFPDQQTNPSAPMYVGNPYMSGYSGSIFTPSQDAFISPSENFEDEPPLLEELGINPEHIVQRTLTVLNPFRHTDVYVMQDNDMAGPLVFCVLFGAMLLLSGKVHFNYIYGIGVLGCLGMYALLSLMATNTVTLAAVASILGYCMLPMVVLSGIGIIFSLQGFSGILLTLLAVTWCALSASKLFVTSHAMEHQQLLVAYPCALLYAVFALITVF